MQWTINDEDDNIYKRDIIVGQTTPDTQSIHDTHKHLCKTGYFQGVFHIN